LGAFAAEKTPNYELDRFLQSLAKGKKRLMENHDRGLVLGAAEEQLVKLDAMRAAEERLKDLQKEVGRRTRAGPGRHRESPKRKASQKSGLLNRDGLVLKLQECGLEFREARETLDAILGAIIDSLRRGEEVIVPPLGSFVVKEQPKEKRRTRLGRVQTLFRQPSKVVFRPGEVLRLKLAFDRNWPQETKVTTQQQELQCPKCGSMYFTECEFRKWHQMPSATPGGGLSASDSRTMQALICVCGEPVPLGPLRRRVEGDQASFRKSLEAAQRYREEAEPQRIILWLAASFASNKDQKDLEDRIASMAAIVAALPKASRPVKKKK
jgi:nucleoid DNA-binding protein